MAGLRLAVRTLTKTPFVTAIAVVSLALGIGANTAIYSLFDRVLLRSLPVSEPDRLVNLSAPGPKQGSTSCNQSGGCDEIFSYPMFRDLQQANVGFSGLAAHRSFDVNLAFEGETLSGQGALVSGSYFPVLGLRPALGRLLDPSDDVNIGEHFVTVLSYDYWQSRLGSDPSVLNRAIVVNGQPLTIVGVAPQDFMGTTLGSPPDVFVPITMRRALQPLFDGFDNRSSYWAYVFGRLAPGVTMERASANLNVVYHNILNDVEAELQSNMSESAMTRFRSKEVVLDEGYRGQSRTHEESEVPLKLLLSITALVLLIACANIANLLLARGAARTQEMAVRGSLGASRWRLLSQLLTESVVLALMGGVASLVVAKWTLSGIVAILPPEVSADLALGMDWNAALFTGALALGTGVLFGLFPALQATRPDLVTMLKSSSGQPGGSRAAARFRASLVTAQISLSMALLVAAGLFIKSLVNVGNVDLGLQTEGVVTFAISPVLNGYESERNRQIFAQVTDEVSALPGVTSVSMALVPVLAGSSWGTDVAVEGFEAGPDTDSNSRYSEVGPGFLATLGMPLLAGREFTVADAEGAPRVAIINEAFARKFGLDPRQAVGKFMSRDGSRATDLNTEIIGVVQDAKYMDVKRDVPEMFLSPYSQSTDHGFMNFYVRTAVDPTQVLRAIPRVMKGIDPNLPIEGLKTLEQQVREHVFLDRMISTLSAAFAVLATLLAAVGLYGVLAYTVAQRTREIGMRMALGAGANRVRRMVLGQVVRMMVVGGVIGVLLALALGRAAQSLLFGLEGNDPWVVVIVGIGLSAVAVGAGYFPAARAAKVDPMQALRYE